MKTKIFNSIKKTLHNSRIYTVMVYGELTDVNEMTGFYAVPVKFNGKTGKPISIDYDKRFVTPSYKEYYCKTKVFNMGWSICVDSDEFNEEIGIKICKRRFNRSPITTQNGRFLTTDMCQAIVNNEVEYIINHIESFLPKNEPKLKFIPMDESGIQAFNDMVDEGIKPLDSSEIIIEFNDDTEKDSGTNDVIVNDGDYVYFERNNTPYLGIFMKEVVNENTNEWIKDDYYFYAPIDDNGLIKHSDARFYSSVDAYDGFDDANEDDIKLITDYLKGAHSKIWDKELKKFKIVFV